MFPCFSVFFLPCHKSCTPNAGVRHPVPILKRYGTCMWDFFYFWTGSWLFFFPFHSIEFLMVLLSIAYWTFLVNTVTFSQADFGLTRWPRYGKFALSIGIKLYIGTFFIKSKKIISKPVVFEILPHSWCLHLLWLTTLVSILNLPMSKIVNIVRCKVVCPFFLFLYMCAT